MLEELEPAPWRYDQNDNEVEIYHHPPDTEPGGQISMNPPKLSGLTPHHITIHILEGAQVCHPTAETGPFKVEQFLLFVTNKQWNS